MKSLKKIICLVGPYLNQNCKQLVVYLLVAMIYFSLNLGQPFIVGQFIDNMMEDLSYRTILICCVAFLAVSVLQVIFSYYVKTTGTRLQCSISNDMKIHFFRHFQQTSPRFHMREDASAMAEKINNDCEYLVIFLLNFSMQFPGKLVCFLFATYYVFVVDLWCGLAVLAFLPVLALYSYFAIITTSFSYFLSIGQETQQYMAYYSRLNELSDIPKERNGANLPKRLNRISVDNMQLAYAERNIFDGISLNFERNKIYCIVGKNGGGKSTLAKLILGLYTDDTGKKILYNGIPIAEINMYEMRKTRIGVSEQEPVMLNGTVGFNITYSEGCVDVTEIEKLMKIVNFCSEEDHEINTLLSMDAATLSGGQKQKISIVKALYKSPELLLLDEPTSALDSVSKQKLVQYLRNTSSGRITILISHDADIINLADEVVSIENISS